MVDFKSIEKKWQKRWEDSGIFVVKEDPKKKKFYCLEMLPYPSGRLHMGHMRNYSIGDSIARYKRMNGFNVLYPMGYDAFGLPAENAAIKNKVNPKKWTLDNIEFIKNQQKSLGLSYDWTRSVSTCLPDYYKWNQWIFLKMFEKGLAYKKAAPVNWCPSCNTVLANEQVEDGKCWRCSSEVGEKRLEQWFFKITEYADELLKDISKLDHWPERVRTMQTNWIGKSEGLIESWDIEGTNEKMETFTTWPHTTLGVTFIVLAPEHPLVLKLVKGTKHEKGALEFIEKVKKQSLVDRTNKAKEKEGYFIGKYALNYATSKKMPIYIANFAIMEYGTGVVKCCPAHDQRDFEFAKKYGIEILPVIKPENGSETKAEKMTKAYHDEGVMINALHFNGMKTEQAREEFSKWAIKQGRAKKTTQFKLRDWLISRQRYWGTPIPIVYCDKCGTLPVPEKDLPVLLPEDVKFTGEGNPVATSKKFVETSCPKCKGKARRETDTMDTFVDSSWYFIRYCSAKSSEMFDKQAIKYWMPVDQYIGGIEHAILHLLYARFFVKVLRDMKMLDFDEPFLRLLSQGMITKDGAKMSKSKGNVVSPDEITEKYGADTGRFFILFASDPEKELEWSDKGVEGSFKFLNKVFGLLEQQSKSNIKDKVTESKLNKTIQKITEHIEGYQFNLALNNIMAFVNHLNKNKENISKKIYSECLQKLALLLNPFVPHTSEEIWSELGNKGFASTEKWPKFDQKKIDEKAEYAEDFVEKVVCDVKEVLNLLKVEKPNQISVYVSDEWKYSLFKQTKKQLETTHNTGEILKEVMKDGEMKKHGKEVPGIVGNIVKDPSKIPEIVLSQKEELGILECSKSVFEKEFGCKVEIIGADKSTSQRAKKAEPGKPGIEVV